jgi:hypothetical protein
MSFADAEPLEDVSEDIVRRAAARDLFECATRFLQIREYEFFWQGFAVIEDGAPRSLQRAVGLLDERDVTHVCDRWTI